jgi:hypothetical protein
VVGPSQRVDSATGVQARDRPLDLREHPAEEGARIGEAPDLAGARQGRSGRGDVAETQRQLADGVTESEIEGTSGDTVSVLGVGRSAHVRSYRATTRRRADGTEATEYVLGATVESDRADDAAFGLSRSAGTAGRADLSGASSGNWGMEIPLTPAQLATFVRAVRSGSAHPRTLLGDADAGFALAAELRRARDRDAQSRAIAEFIRATGPGGLAWVRRHAGATAPVDLTLEGSQVFRGAESRAALEGRITRYEREIAAGGRAAHAARRHAGSELRGLRSRLVHLEDRSRYRELPDEMRTDELTRTRAWISRLEGVLRTRVEATTEERTAAVAEGPLTETFQRAEVPDEQGSAALNRRLDRLAAQADRMAEASQRSLAAVELSRRVHLHGYGIGMGEDTTPAYEAYGRRATGIAARLGLSSDGESAGDYERADRLYREGSASHRAGERSRDEGARLRAQLDDPSQTFRFDVLARQASLQLETAVSSFTAAKTKLDSSEGQYQALRRRYSPRHPNVFAGYR